MIEISTPVLCADQTWKSVGGLQVDDELISCDEAPNPTAAVYLPSFVTVNNLVTDDLLLVTTIFGNVQCTPSQQWLVVRDGVWAWIETSNLLIGDLVVREARAAGAWRGANILSIATVDVGSVAQLSTTTNTFLALGFVMHV